MTKIKGMKKITKAEHIKEKKMRNGTKNSGTQKQADKVLISLLSGLLC